MKLRNLYVFFLLLVQPSLFTFPRLLVRKIPSPKDMSNFLFSTMQHDEAKEGIGGKTGEEFWSNEERNQRLFASLTLPNLPTPSKMLLGIFITHNTNFPCLTQFASSNEIIDRYKNKDADEGENLFSCCKIMLRVAREEKKAMGGKIK